MITPASAQISDAQRSLYNARLAANAAGVKMIQKNEETGSLSLNPFEMIKSMKAKQAKMWFDAYGMTPAAQTRIITNPQGNLPLDPADGYF